MRIGIDARELCGHPTGVGRYLSGLLTAWAADPGTQQHEFVLYAHEPLTLEHDSGRFHIRIVRGLAGTLWEQLRLPKAIAGDRLDVFFAPAYSAPLLNRIPTVVTLHDVSFVAHPEWFARREGARRRWLARQSAARAAAIITVSEFSRREIRRYFQVADDRLHVVRSGVTAPAISTSPTDSSSLRTLYVGSVFNRRRVPDLIRAFAPIARAHATAELSMVGDNRTFPYQDLDGIIAHEGLSGRVRWKPYVSEEELSGLYSSSRAFAFLSEYEGLGQTPLEALAAGVPPVLLDTEVARESCEDAALYVPPDVNAATTALNQLLFDTDRRAALLAAAPRALAKYTWPRAASETLQVLERAAARS
jgi:glycosyltransferase involved in cell wall biosynthesis